MTSSRGTYQAFQILEPETGPPEEHIDACRAFIAQARWTYAKTMPQWPHEYALRERVRAQGIEREFDEFAALIDKHGFAGRFHRARRMYLNVDEWRYWKMEPFGVPPISVLNRARRDGGGIDQHDCCALATATGGKHHAKHCKNFKGA